MTQSNKYGPAKAELKFRLFASLAGLSLMTAAIVFKGIPSGPAFFEVVVIAGGFFGGTALWSGLKLSRKDYPGE